jgi:uncharacterized membrane protein
MKKVLIIFAGLILVISSLVTVQASENQAASVQAKAESASADSSAYAKDLFEGRCQMCHQLPEPDMLRAKQWRLILTTMQQRMQQAGVPPLTEDETETILEYIAEQSR